MSATQQAAAQLGDEVARQLYQLARSDDPHDRAQAADALLGALDYCIATETPLSTALAPLDALTCPRPSDIRKFAVLKAHALLSALEGTSEAATASRIEGWPVDPPRVEPPELQELLEEALASGADFPVSARTAQRVLAAGRGTLTVEHQRTL